MASGWLGLTSNAGAEGAVAVAGFGGSVHIGRTLVLHLVISRQGWRGGERERKRERERESKKEREREREEVKPALWSYIHVHSQCSREISISSN